MSADYSRWPPGGAVRGQRARKGPRLRAGGFLLGKQSYFCTILALEKQEVIIWQGAREPGIWTSIISVETAETDWTTRRYFVLHAIRPRQAMAAQAERRHLLMRRPSKLPCGALGISVSASGRPDVTNCKGLIEKVYFCFRQRCFTDDLNPG